MISGVPLPPKITFFLSVRGNLLYLMLNHKQGIITKNTSQSTHFIKSESTYHGPVIYFLSCRSTNVTQLFCCYLLNWAHNVWKSHGTTVTPPGSSGFMLNSEDRHFQYYFQQKMYITRSGSLSQCQSLKYPSHI